MDEEQIIADFQEYIETAWQFCEVKTLKEEEIAAKKGYAGFILKFDSGARFLVQVRRV